MRTTAVLLAALVLALPVAAQTAKPVTPPAKVAAAPTISDTQKAAYWKAVAQQQSHQAQADFLAKQDANGIQAAIQVMSKVCGLDANLQQDPNGDPVCVLKLAEKK